MPHGVLLNLYGSSEVAADVTWYDTRALHFTVLGSGLALFLGVLVAAVVRLFGRGGAGPPPSRAALIGRRLLLGAAICYLGFAVALGVLMSDPIALFSGHLTGVEIALALPVLGAGLTLGAAWSAVLQWKTGAGSMGGEGAAPARPRPLRPTGEIPMRLSRTARAATRSGSGPRTAPTEEPGDRCASEMLLSFPASGGAGGYGPWRTVISSAIGLSSASWWARGSS